MAEITLPDESEVKEAWVDFKVDYSNTPLSYDDAVDQFSRFMRNLKADVLFDYADYLAAVASTFTDQMTEQDRDENDRFIESLRTRGHQIKKGA